MKKNPFIAVKTRTGVCDLAESLVDFDTLSKHIDEIEASDFSFNEIGWNGCGDFEDLEKNYRIVPTGRKIKLRNPIWNSGYDYDMGHEYPWSIEFDEIWEGTRLPEPEKSWYEPNKKSNEAYSLSDFVSLLS